MSKILLTFIGNIESYREQEYKFEDKFLFRGQFYPFKLAKKLGIKDIVLFINKSLNYDDLIFIFEEFDLSKELIEEIEDLLNEGLLKEIENLLKGNLNANLYLVEINDKDLNKSFGTIKEEIETLNEQLGNLEINLDITHSYRHLPLFVLLSLDIFTVKKENIKLENIFYAIDRGSYFEILKLKKFIHLLNFSKALKNFIIHGQLFDFANELKNINKEEFIENKENLEEIIKNIEKYSNILEGTDFYLNLNYLDALLDNFRKLKSNLVLIEPTFNLIPLNYIYEEFKKFINRFDTNRVSQFQFQLAKWHLEHRRYAIGLITLREAFISRYIEKKVLTTYNEEEVKSRRNRENVENPLRDTNYTSFWNVLSMLRNISAHNLGSGERQTAVDYFKGNENKLKEFLLTLSPKKLDDRFPNSLDEIFQSI